jgi:hypothetical protein
MVVGGLLSLRHKTPDPLAAESEKAPEPVETK